MWRGDVATKLSPEVSVSNIVDPINLPVSFRQMNSHTDTSKSIISPPLSSADTDAPNWNDVSPWSPPATAWLQRTSAGFADLLCRWRCKYLDISSSILFSDYSKKLLLLFPFAGEIDTAIIHNSMALGEHSDVSSWWTEAWSEVSFKMFLDFLFALASNSWWIHHWR